MRYLLSAGEDEHGPLLAAPDGKVLVFRTHESACEAAKELVQDGPNNGMPPGCGVFVHKLLATAFYLPVPVTETETMADETQVFPQVDHDQEKPDGNSN